MDCAGHGAWCRDKISVFNQDPLVNPNTDGFRIGYSIDTKFGSYERNSGGKREGWHWLRWGQSNWRKIAKGSYRVDSLMTHWTQCKICWSNSDFKAIWNVILFFWYERWSPSSFHSLGKVYSGNLLKLSILTGGIV